MKNIYHETIGAYSVITAVTPPAIDPEAAKAAAAPALAASAEWERVKSVQLKIAAARKEARGKAALAREAEEAGNEAKAKQYAAEWHAAHARIPALEEELKPLLDAYEKKREALFMENPAYFLPGPGAVQASDEEAAPLEAKLAALKEHEKLTLEGEVIPDYRGVEYWQKTGGVWVKTKIEDIGIGLPGDAILPGSLSEAVLTEIAAQEEAARIAGLTPEQKAAGKQASLDALADEAARLEKRAQIQGNDFDAAAWYGEHKTAVEAKYA
ncbi:MAG: hypothetical protein LBK08_10325 [Treponema sp.]|jgi:hypothetical protein|nr:hypothetical protein [Treponema sp.]